MCRLEFIQGRLIKLSLGLTKRSHNTAFLKALNIEKGEGLKPSASTDAALIGSCYVLWCNGTWNPAR